MKKPSISTCMGSHPYGHEGFLIKDTTRVSKIRVKDSQMTSLKDNGFKTWNASRVGSTETVGLFTVGDLIPFKKWFLKLYRK